MSCNLLLWKWSSEFDTPKKRKKAGLKFADITAQFAATEDHPAIGEANIKGLQESINTTFGADELTRPFVIEKYPKCVVVNYSESARLEIVPKIAAIGRQFNLNAAEF